MKNHISIFLFSLVLLFTSCTQDQNAVKISVKNVLDFDRNEVVAIDRITLSSLLEGKNESNIQITEMDSKENMMIQWIDNDADGTNDQLLFQAELTANQTKTYEISWQENVAQPASELTTYSRFVPERTDDYTWENDKVAFRTYGPEAQSLIEANEKGGTLSSGIDLWLKKVGYSIIDKWYAENVKQAGYYHIDHGEGYDPYHVGKSRGTGGIGVWVNDSLITSKNFTAYRTLATGPLRTVFELDYAPWSDYGINETKRISLDLGANFSKFEISLTADTPVPNYTIGITLHDGKGEAKINAEEGVFSHWEPIGENFVGEGIVIDPMIVKDAFALQSDTPDQSQILIVADAAQEKLTYYAGFAWTGSEQVSNSEDWAKKLEEQVAILDNPLMVSILK